MKLVPQRPDDHAIKHCETGIPALRRFNSLKKNLSRMSPKYQWPKTKDFSTSFEKILIEAKHRIPFFGPFEKIIIFVL
jgi:hypothetical protein